MRECDLGGTVYFQTLESAALLLLLLVVVVVASSSFQSPDSTEQG